MHLLMQEKYVPGQAKSALTMTAEAFQIEFVHERQTGHGDVNTPPGLGRMEGDIPS